MHNSSEMRIQINDNSLLRDMNVTQRTILESKYYGFLRINYTVISILICGDGLTTSAGG